MDELTFKDRLNDLKLVVFDFDGVLTDNRVYVNELGEESVSCSRLDGLGLSNLRKIGLPAWVLSTEKNPVVGRRCEKLQIDYIQGSESKLPDLQKIADKFEASLHEVMFVGNDINDLECLESVGLPVVVSDAHQDVMKDHFFMTKAAGGHGAVREICDLIFSILEN